MCAGKEQINPPACSRNLTLTRSCFACKTHWRRDFSLQLRAFTGFFSRGAAPRTPQSSVPAVIWPVYPTYPSTIAAAKRLEIPYLPPDDGTDYPTKRNTQIRGGGQVWSKQASQQLSQPESSHTQHPLCQMLVLATLLVATAAPAPR